MPRANTEQGGEFCVPILYLPYMFMGQNLDIFETPVTVTPQQEISKTLNSSKIP